MNDRERKPKTSQKALKWRWLDSVYSADGPASTTRSVLMALALHMSNDGGDCYPSTRRVAKESGFSHRTILTHLKNADEQGWIRRSERRRGGKGWRRHEYQPTIPNLMKEVHHLQGERDEGDSSPSAERGEDERKNVVKEVHLRNQKEKPDTETSALWEVWLEELGGKGLSPTLTPKRSQLLRKLDAEQLRKHDDPQVLFRFICRALRASEYHMSKRAYQLPESFLRNAERRERWTEDGLALLMSGSKGSTSPYRRLKA